MINIYYNYYSDSDKKRAFEIDSCLKMLVENSAADQLFILVEPGENIPFFNDQCTKVVLSKRPTFADILEIIADKSGENDVNMFMNSDCFILEDGVRAIEQIGEAEAYCISRREIRKAEPLRVRKLRTAKLWRKHLDMQDFWCFRGIPKEGMEVDFHMGKPGCDNRMAYELEKAGYTIKNPRSSIPVYHYHTTELRRYVEVERIPGPYAFPAVL